MHAIQLVVEAQLVAMKTVWSVGWLAEISRISEKSCLLSSAVQVNLREMRVAGKGYTTSEAARPESAPLVHVE